MHRFETYHIYLIPMLLAATVSLRVFMDKWPTPYRIFSALLWMTLLIEFGAIFWATDWHKVDGLWSYNRWNNWIYNAGLIVRLVFLLWFYHSIISSVRVRRLIRWIGGLALLLLAGIYLRWTHVIFVGYFLVFNATMMLLSFLYFRQLLKNDEIVELKKDPIVWISIGVLASAMINLPVFTFMDLLVNTNLQEALTSLYYNDVLNILTYTLFLIAFLCKPQPKPLPLPSLSPH